MNDSIGERVLDFIKHCPLPSDQLAYELTALIESNVQHRRCRACSQPMQLSIALCDKCAHVPAMKSP